MDSRRLAAAIMATVLTAFLGTGVAWSSSAAACDWRHEQRLLGPSRDINDVAFLDDPNLIAVADNVNVVIWNLATGLQELFIRCNGLAPPRYPSQLRVLLADAEGRRIVAATSHYIVVWDGKTAEEQRRLRGAGMRPHTLSLSRDGRLLAARTDARSVTVWDLDTGLEAFSLYRMRLNVTSLALSADGSRLAVGDARGGAKVWDLATGAELAHVEGHGKGHNGRTRRVDLTPDGGRLATGGRYGIVKVWDVSTGAEIVSLNAGASVTSVRMKANGTRLVTATGKGPARLWNVETGAVVRTFGRGGLHPRHVRLSADGRRVAAIGLGWHYAAGKNGHGVWMTGTGREAPTVRARRWGPAGVQLSDDGGRALAFYRDGHAVLLDTSTGVALREFKGPPRRPISAEARRSYNPRPDATHAFRTIRLLGGGRRVLDITRDAGIVVRDADTTATLGSFGEGPTIDYPCVLSPDHRMLLTGDPDGSAHLWDVEMRSFLRTLPGDGSRVLSASFDGASRVVLTGSMDGTITAWDTRSGEALGTLPTTAPGAHAVSLSPDGKRALTWRRSQLVRGQRVDVAAVSQLWDIHSGAPMQLGIPARVWGCVWRTDSRRFYTTGAEAGGRAVQAWSPEDLARRSDMRQAPAWVRPALYDPNRPPSTTPGSMGVLLDDTPGYPGMLPFDRHHGVYRVAMSQDGATFAAVTDDGSIDVWRRRPDAGTTPREPTGR